MAQNSSQLSLFNDLDNLVSSVSSDGSAGSDDADQAETTAPVLRLVPSTDEPPAAHTSQDSLIHQFWLNETTLRERLIRNGIAAYDAKHMRDTEAMKRGNAGRRAEHICGIEEGVDRTLHAVKQALGLV